MQKTNFKTRLLALLTAVFMVIVSIPFAAFADDNAKFGLNVVKGANVESIAVEGKAPWTFAVGDNFDLSSFGAKAAEGYLLQYQFDITKEETHTFVTVKSEDAATFKFGSEFEGAIDVTMTALGYKDDTPAPTKVKMIVQADVKKGTMAGATDGMVVGELPADWEIFDLPTVTAKDGYVFAGWHVDAQIGEETTNIVSKDYAADAKEIKSGDFAGASRILVSAVFNDAPAAKLKVMVQADVKKGTMAGATDGVISGEVADGWTNFDVPAVTAKEGYVFAGWHVDAQIGETSEVKSKDYGAETTTIDLSEFAGASRILITAVFNDAPAAKVKIMVQADVNKGTMAGATDGVVSGEVPAEWETFSLPAVTAKEGYVFTGWHVDAQIGETTEMVSKDYAADAKEIKISEFPGASRILISAVFEAEATNGKVIFVLQYDANKGKIDGVKAEGESTEVPADAKFELPVSKVSANDGFYFNGWTVVAQFADKTTKTVTLSKDATTVNMADYKGAKYVGVMPIFAEQYNGDIVFVLQYDKTKGKIDGVKAEGESTTVPNDAKFELPTAKVSANDGYKFAGWTVLVQYADQSNKTFTLGADAKLVNMADYKYAKYVGVMPVFEKEQKNDNKANNTSSSSSSSNKTTTASNEKQVVKAAAAPANTTKVLPKTGASNVAPLLGGSLAVVALLMGYGVYSLVLRKKD